MTAAGIHTSYCRSCTEMGGALYDEHCIMTPPEAEPSCHHCNGKGTLVARAGGRVPCTTCVVIRERRAAGVSSSKPFTIRQPKPHTIAIMDDTGRKLLVLDVVDGGLVATYDEADLDEAARVFVRECVKIWPL